MSNIDTQKHIKNIINKMTIFNKEEKYFLVAIIVSFLILTIYGNRGDQFTNDNPTYIEESSYSCVGCGQW